MNHVWISRSTGHRTQQQLHGENLYHALYYVQPVLLDLIGSWLYDLVVGIVLVFFFILVQDMPLKQLTYLNYMVPSSITLFVVGNINCQIIDKPMNNKK